MKTSNVNKQLTYGYDNAGDTHQPGVVSDNGSGRSLLPSPYITITPTGYTKHYYVGSNRIATLLGEGGWSGMANKDTHDNAICAAFNLQFKVDWPCEHFTLTNNVELLRYGFESYLQYGCEPLCLQAINNLGLYNILATCISTYSHASGNYEAPFYIHSDHLGSASWITDDAARPMQYIHYAPYGELIANQSLNGYDERYKFTGKERDTETGYDFFGARYLAQQLGIWTSPDPLLDKYLYVSPYMYCNGNPIKFVDPNGERCKLSIKGNVITISAKYYVQKKDIASAQKAIGFWNNQKNLRYKSSQGKEYIVQFKLTVKLSKRPVKEAERDVDLDANSYVVVSSLAPNINGQTEKHYKIQVTDAKKDTFTGAHEVGHTLMQSDNPDDDHSNSGIMTPYATSPERSETVSQETVDKIVESNGFEQKNQTIWQRIKSLFD